MLTKFKAFKERYEEVLKRYNDNTIKIEGEIEGIYKDAINEIKKINLLKMTGLRIHISKYLKNMEYLEATLNKANLTEALTVNEENIIKADLIKKEYPNFFDFLGFNSKNIVQKILYMALREKKIKDEVIGFEKEIDDIIYRRELLVIYNKLMRDQVKDLRGAIENLLKYIDYMQGQFAIYKKDILLSKNPDGSFNNKKLTWEAGIIFYRYNEAIELLIEVIRDKYAFLENETSKGKDIIRKINTVPIGPVFLDLTESENFQVI